MSRVVICVLGGTGAGWHFNSTPVQRSTFLSEIATVVCVDQRTKIAAGLEGKAFYIQTPDWGQATVAKMLCKFPDIKRAELLFWGGPSWVDVRLARSLARNFGGRFVVDLYDDIRLPAGIAWARKHWIRALYHEARAIQVKPVISTCDLLIRSIAADVFERDVPLDRQINIMNGVCDQVYELGSDWASHVWGREPFHCCFVGFFDAERARILEPVLKLANERGYSLRLTAIGPYDPQFSSAIFSHLESRHGHVDLRFTGETGWAQAMKILSSADCGIYSFPKRPELECVYPIKLGEYMALGKPILSSDLRGAREMVGDSGAAIFVNPNDPEEWLLAIDTLIKSPSLCREMAVAGRERAAKILWSQMHEPLQEKLRELLVTQ